MVAVKPRRFRLNTMICCQPAYWTLELHISRSTKATARAANPRQYTDKGSSGQREYATLSGPLHTLTIDPFWCTCGPLYRLVRGREVDMRELLPSVRLRLYCTLVEADEVWVAYTAPHRLWFSTGLKGAGVPARAACPLLQVLLVLCGFCSCLSWPTLALSNGGSCR